MQQEVPSIDEMPYLKARLGKARSDRVRYSGQADASRQKGSTNLLNTVIGPMQFVTPHEPGCPVADVLQGVSHIDHQSLPLSVNRLYIILQCISVINTREIMKMMSVDKRQAQRYVRAIKFALPHIQPLM